MPSKRQPSKQRRAAENRAKRQALAARSVHAQTPRPASSGQPYRKGGGGSAGKGSTYAATSTAGKTSGSSGGLLGGLFNLGGDTAPGFKAVQMGALLSLVGFVLAMIQPVKVDDRGEEIPQVWMHGLYLKARSLVAGKSITGTNASLIDARGWVAVLMLLTPVVVAVVTFISFRQRPAAKTLTIAMLLLAVSIVLNTPNQDRAIFMMPALIAIAVASFQVRKAGMLEAQRDADPRRAAAEPEPEDDEPDDYDDEDEEYEEEISEYEDGDEYDEEEVSEEEEEETKR